MLYKLENDKEKVGLKNEQLNQISGGLCKMGKNMYLTNAGEVNYLFDVKINQAGGNVGRVAALNVQKVTALRDAQSYGYLLPTGDYTYFRDHPDYKGIFSSAKANSE
jgi:hypothetical protein